MTRHTYTVEHQDRWVVNRRVTDQTSDELSPQTYDMPVAEFRTEAEAHGFIAKVQAEEGK